MRAKESGHGVDLPSALPLSVAGTIFGRGLLGNAWRLNVYRTGLDSSGSSGAMAASRPPHRTDISAFSIVTIGLSCVRLTARCFFLTFERMDLPILAA